MDQPTISFVVAALNEEQTIESCVRSLLDQHYPADRIEVAVVDGGSADRTREIVARMADGDPRVRLLHNPAGIAPRAFNIGVARTGGRLISLQSAHGAAGQDYAEVLASAFAKSGAALVGGRVEARTASGASSMAEAIARAMSSPLGVGSARYHYSDEPGWVDTAYPGAYRRELFDEIGGFDESLVRNQDDELHFRARLAGHRMWYEPGLRSVYLPRRTLAALWRQYFDYGWWRSVTLVKHRRVASWRHLVPATLVAGLAAGPLLASVTPRRRRTVARAWSGGVAAWLAVLVVSGTRERTGPAHIAPRVPVAVGCLHLAYGAGFWRGLLDQAGRRVRRS
jgi:GT2 family glycosyltransferase